MEIRHNAVLLSAGISWITRSTYCWLLWVWKLRFAKSGIATAVGLVLVFAGYLYLPLLGNPVSGAARLFGSTNLDVSVISEWGRYIPAKDAYQMTVRAKAGGLMESGSIAWSSPTDKVKIETSRTSRKEGALTQSAIITAPASSLVVVEIVASSGPSYYKYQLDRLTAAPSTKQTPVVKLAAQMIEGSLDCSFTTAASIVAPDSAYDFLWHSDANLEPKTLQSEAEDLPPLPVGLSGDGYVNEPVAIVQWTLRRFSQVTVWADAADRLDLSRPVGTSSELVLQCR